MDHKSLRPSDSARHNCIIEAATASEMTGLQTTTCMRILSKTVLAIALLNPSEDMFALCRPELLVYIWKHRRTTIAQAMCRDTHQEQFMSYSSFKKAFASTPANLLKNFESIRPTPSQERIIKLHKALMLARES